MEEELDTDLRKIYLAVYLLEFRIFQGKWYLKNSKIMA